MFFKHYTSALGINALIHFVRTHARICKYQRQIVFFITSGIRNIFYSYYYTQAHVRLLPSAYPTAQCSKQDFEISWLHSNTFIIFLSFPCTQTCYSVSLASSELLYIIVSTLLLSSLHILVVCHTELLDHK